MSNSINSVKIVHLRLANPSPAILLTDRLICCMVGGVGENLTSFSKEITKF